MSYTNLKSDVAGFLHRTDLDGQMDTFVTLAEAMINEGLRGLENQTALDVSFSGKTYDLPADYLEVCNLSLDIDVQPSQVSLQQLSEIKQTGNPVAYAIHSGVIEWSVDIVDAIDGTLIYVNQLPPLTANVTNDVLDKYPLLYLSAMLFYGFQYLQDDANADKWIQIYTSQLNSINKNSGSYVLPQVR